jgi:hypothetical protein
MPLSPDDQLFRKEIYQKLQDKPLEVGDPLYEPIYGQPGCEDPIEQLESYITLAETESLSLFSGFSGSGKTTELFRLRHRLQQAGYVVLYADARKYLDEGHPLQLSELLFVIAGAFSDALAEHNIELRTESYWTRFYNWLTTTDVNLKELGFQAEAGAGAAKAGASMRLELTTASTLRQRLSDALSNRVGELRDEVMAFIEDGCKALREARGPDTKVVFLFDQMEQLAGSLFNEAEMVRSFARLFTRDLGLLSLPYVHAVYTVPPGIKFHQPGCNMVLLPCVRVCNKGPERAVHESGMASFETLVQRRFTAAGLLRFFGPDPMVRARRLIGLSGGHFRDLLLLLRETVVRAGELPVADTAIEGAIIRVRSNYMPIPKDVAQRLDRISREHTALLDNGSPEETIMLTQLLNAHILLYLRNGAEWYDVHPLVREEVARIAAPATS